MDGRAVTVIASLALILAVGLALAGFFLAPGNAAIPTSLAFTFIGMLGIAVGRSLKTQAERLAHLERLLRDRPPGAA
jgi:xanthosine utilization system XapX-like protein